MIKNILDKDEEIIDDYGSGQKPASKPKPEAQAPDPEAKNLT